MINLIYTLLLGANVYAMKPAPFTSKTDIKNHTLSTGLILESKRLDDGNYSKNGKTTIYDKKKAKWSADVFIGRRRYDFSPDGEYMILYGSVYYTSNTFSEGVFVKIYKSGKLIKSILLKNIVGDVKTYAKKNDILIMGGGWISSNKLMQKKSVDWKEKTLEFVVSPGNKKLFEFKHI